MLHFPEICILFALYSQSLNYTFQLCVNWPAAAADVLSTVDLKTGN